MPSADRCILAPQRFRACLHTNNNVSWISLRRGNTPRTAEERAQLGPQAPAQLDGYRSPYINLTTSRILSQLVQIPSRPTFQTPKAASRLLASGSLFKLQNNLDRVWGHALSWILREQSKSCRASASSWTTSPRGCAKQIPQSRGPQCTCCSTLDDMERLLCSLGILKSTPQHL